MFQAVKYVSQVSFLNQNAQFQTHRVYQSRPNGHPPQYFLDFSRSKKLLQNLK